MSNILISLLGQGPLKSLGKEQCVCLYSLQKQVFSLNVKNIFFLSLGL